MTLEQERLNVVATGGHHRPEGPLPASEAAQILPGSALLIVGIASKTPVELVRLISGPETFGSPFFTVATTGTVDKFGINAIPNHCSRRLHFRHGDIRYGDLG